ncbi:MAG: DNA alkylation repair protein [Coriobacteriaceae bacterium]|nr:DNA alkylation repair protein [Coriobacteriaceae bacterium]
MQSVVDELASLADPAYREFQAKLVPTVDPARILGVRTPELRAFARRFAADDRCDAFLAELPHRTYEEMNLHAELIARLAATPDQAVAMLDAFLPHVDNWATCDLIRTPAFKRDHPAALAQVCRWTAPGMPEYAVRFGVNLLIEHFLKEDFSPDHLGLVARIDRVEYYINMARAWYLSLAIVRHPDEALPFFEERPLRLDPWTHNKALQKARESRVPTAEQKAYLQALKVKVPRAAKGTAR